MVKELYLYKLRNVPLWFKVGVVFSLMNKFYGVAKRGWIIFGLY